MENVIFAYRMPFDPTNIKIKLIDFGLAIELKNESLFGEVGTPYFLSPDRVLNFSYGT